jgi:putative hydrolase
MLADLLKMVKTEGPVQWEVAAQLAGAIASEGQGNENVEPVERMRFEELIGIADLHVADITGMSTSTSGSVQAVPVDRPEWARRTLEGWRPLLNRLASYRAAGGEEAEPGDEGGGGGAAEGDAGGAGGNGGRETGGHDVSGESSAGGRGPGSSALPHPSENRDGEQDDDALTSIFEQWATAFGPMLLALQVGSVVGHLSTSSFGQYDLPVPRAQSDELLFVPSNVKRFAEDWSLPLDDVRLWVCLREVTANAVLSRPHVRARLESLMLAHAAAFRPDPRGLQQHLGELDPSDISSLARLLGDPGEEDSGPEDPARRRIRVDLEALVAILGGYVEHTVDEAASRLVASRSLLREALRRRRVERGSGERMAESLFGLKLDQDVIDRGNNFVKGVLERSGERELAKLWVVEANLPTPAEVEAPGLWIERVNLP